MSRLIQLLEEHALAAMEKQEQFSGLTGDHVFQIDLGSGTARCGDLEFSMQVLGTQSDNTLTWLWAWAEEQAEVPEGLQRASRELREWGERNGVPELTEPEVDLDRADGRMLSLVAVQLCGAACAYRDQYDGGAVFLLLYGQEIGRQPGFTAARLEQVLRELSSEYEIVPRNALLAYVRLHALRVETAGAATRCRLANGESFSMAFDEQGRILDE